MKRAPGIILAALPGVSRRVLQQPGHMGVVERIERLTAIPAHAHEAGGAQDDLSDEKSDAEIAREFCALSEDYLGAKRTAAVLDRLWHVETAANVASIPPALVVC